MILVRTNCRNQSVWTITTMAIADQQIEPEQRAADDQCDLAAAAHWNAPGLNCTSVLLRASFSHASICWSIHRSPRRRGVGIGAEAVGGLHIPCRRNARGSGDR